MKTFKQFLKEDNDEKWNKYARSNEIILKNIKEIIFEIENDLNKLENQIAYTGDGIIITSKAISSKCKDIISNCNKLKDQI